MTFGTLPDDVLLEIFNFYVDEANDVDAWHSLVHVCRKWRNVAFASPRRLNLQLRCTYRRSVRKMLDLWPELPIAIADAGNTIVEGAENVVAALEFNDRVSVIFLGNVSGPILVEVSAAVEQVPFPALTDLILWSYDGMAPVISDSFLGVSAPRLQYLNLVGIPIPSLPKLLLSATDLRFIHVGDIPHSGYFPPEAMVTCLSTLTRLEGFSLEFRSPLSRPSRAKPPLTRIILPVLTYLRFKGVTEYLEGLLARIDTPLLDEINITLFNQLIFNTSQLPKFLCRTEQFKALDQADVAFYERSIRVTLSPPAETVPTKLMLSILCSHFDWQLSSLAQVCNSALPTLSTLERLNLGAYTNDPYFLPGQDDIDNTQWLELFHPFTNVKNLHLSEEVAPCIAPALQGLSGEQVKEVLPALQDLFLDASQPSGPVQEALREFISTRQLSGRPVAIHLWEKGK